MTETTLKCRRCGCLTWMLVVLERFHRPICCRCSKCGYEEVL